jgi:hypothetical protein
MRSKVVRFLLGALVLPASGVTAQSQSQFKLTGTAVARPGDPSIIDVSYTNADPDEKASYMARERLNEFWKVKWSAKADSAVTSVKIDVITLDKESQKISLQVSGILPKDARAVYWTVLFLPSDDMPVLPQLASASPRRTPKPDCANQSPNARPDFCPPGNGDTPDFNLNGSFLVAGGSKPIIAAQFKTDVIIPQSWIHWKPWGFYPGVKADVEINQNSQPPNNRTTFDPDSILAGLTFSRNEFISKHGLYGIAYQVQLPEGEFTRKDPSSNIIAGGTAQFVLKAWQQHYDLDADPKPVAYATLYPIIGIEAGRNLNRPGEIDSTPVNLSNYREIFRGLLGADATFGVRAADRKTDIFTITGSYRVRLPALDEPLVKTIHQVTTIDLTTRARHWVEVDISASPWNWKYFALNAKYQYGELPPLFNFVDHKFTIGFSLQAVQSKKPKLNPIDTSGSASPSAN